VDINGVTGISYICKKIKKMKTIKFLTILAVVAMFTSCAKDGATGPAGATGAAGAQGNANVSDSVYTVYNWNYDGANESWFYTFTPTFLTSAIASTGSVSVFLSIDGGNSWNGLPTTYVDPSMLDAYWTFGYATNNVTVYFTWSNLQPFNNPYSVYGNVDCKFKIVCTASHKALKH
jgi:hypothetical protein